MRSLACVVIVVLAVTALAACRNDEPSGAASGSVSGSAPSGSQSGPTGSAPSGSAPSGSAPSGSRSGSAPSGGTPSAAATEARRLYATVCAVCHGASGRGDGTAAANLNPKPRDYTDAAWQATVTDAEIRKTILEGGIAVGKSPIMPGQPQLADQPAVLDHLVALIRSFAKK